MGHIWTTFALFLVFFSGIAFIDSAGPYKCYSFDTSNDWIYDSGFYWKWAPAQLPDYSNIPSFVNTAGYLWFQDQSTPPVSGSYRGPLSDSFTLNYGDTVQATIFRHILQGQNNDTDRPILRFVNNYGVNNVLYNYDYDWWSPVSVTCTSDGSWPLKTAICCNTYPCTGYFRVDGQVLIRDELLGIDDIGINGSCGNPTPPPTAPPTPDNWCCTFYNPDICQWSPAYLTNGWVYSRVTPDPVIESITTTEYIYIRDTSATASSPTLTLVPTVSTFTISYYFQSAKLDSYNFLSATFTSATGYTTTLDASLPTTGGAFYAITLTGTNLCAGASSCSGTFHLTTSNSPGVEQLAALRSFYVNGDTSC